MSIFQSAFSQALGWSLIDSLWQMGTIWLCYCVITFNGTRHSASYRHNLAFIGNATGTLWFLISLFFNYIKTANGESLYSLAYFLEGQAGSGFFENLLPRNTVSAIGLVYLPAVLFFALRLTLQVNINMNIHGESMVPDDNRINDFLRSLSEQYGIKKNVRMRMSNKLQSPLTLGFWKPVIILPIAVLNQLSCREVEAIIAHELFHIKRNDYLLNILLKFTDVILFFNPFARLLSGIVKKERENACDDKVLAAGFDAWEYSHALYLIGRYCCKHNDVAVAATGMGNDYLLQRIRRLLNRRYPSPSLVKPFIAFFLCLAVAGFAIRQTQNAEITNEELQVSKMTYVSDEKPVFNTEVKTPVAKKKSVKKIQGIKKISPPKYDMKPVAGHENEGEEGADTIETPIEEEMHDVYYVTEPETIEFTIIDKDVYVAPYDVVCEQPRPYIPRNSFYYSEVDTLAGKKIIGL